MKYLFLIVLISILYICSFSCNESKTEHVSHKCDTLQIRFTDSINFNWLVSENRIIIDKNFDLIESNILKFRDTLLYFIKDTTDLNINVCTKSNRNLFKGDVAFLFFYQLRLIDYIDNFNICFDYVKFCHYPEGLLDYVDENREFVYSKLKKNITNEYIITNK